MTKTIFLCAFAGLGLVGASAYAQSSPQTLNQATIPGKYSTRNVELLKTGKHLETVTCRDYTMLDENFRPTAVTYGANYGPKGHAHPTVTVAGVENVVPIVTDACRARPGDHFLTAVNNAMVQAHTASQH